MCVETFVLVTLVGGEREAECEGVRERKREMSSELDRAGTEGVCQKRRRYRWGRISAIFVRLSVSGVKRR